MKTTFEVTPREAMLLSLALGLLDQDMQKRVAAAPADANDYRRSMAEDSFACLVMKGKLMDIYNSQPRD